MEQAPSGAEEVAPSAQSALIVSVAEAEPVVGELRRRLDPAAQQGVPPHVTVLYPFLAPAAITGDTLDGLRSALSPIAPFTFHLLDIAQFPATLYLAPLPADPFVALTAAIVARFPGYPPYGGQFPSVIPHLTVAHGAAEELAAARCELAAALAAHGEVRALCAGVALIENSSGRWEEAHRIPLRAGR